MAVLHSKLQPTQWKIVLIDNETEPVSSSRKNGKNKLITRYYYISFKKVTLTVSCALCLLLSLKIADTAPEIKINIKVGGK